MRLIPPQLALALALGGAACATADEQPPSAPLEVELVGCLEVYEHAGCALGAAREITLVYPGAARQFTTDRGAPATLERNQGSHGTRERLRVPDDARSLAEVGRPRRPLVRFVDAAEDAVLSRARALRAAGRRDAARAQLRTLPDTANPATRALATGLLGRLALAENKLEAASDLLLQASTDAARAGLISEAVDAALALSHLASQRKDDYALAERALKLAEKHARAGYAEASARIPYYRALWSLRTRDLRSALAELELASRRATHLGLERLARDVRQMHARTLAELGRVTEGLELLSPDVASARTLPPCEAAQSLAFAAWLSFWTTGRGDAASLPTHCTERDRTWAPAPEPELLARFELARDAAARCGEPTRLKNALVDLSLCALATGEPQIATQALDAARRVATPDAETEAWLLEVEGRRALEACDAEAAERAFTAEAALAQQRDDREGLFRAHVGLGFTDFVRKRFRQAEAHLQRAEREVALLQLAVPLGTGRTGPAHLRAESSQGLVAALLAQGRAEHAEARARAAIARTGISALSSPLAEKPTPDTLRKLAHYRSQRAAWQADVADDWQRSEQALAMLAEPRAERRRELEALLDAALSSVALGSPPRPCSAATTACLTLFPLETRVVSFVRVADRVHAHVAELPAQTESPEAWASALFEPHREHLDDITRLEVRAGGALRALDVHMWPFDERPLAARMTVVYAHELAIPTPRTTQRALVISDPTHTLPRARDEAGFVARLLASRGAEIERLDGDAASHDAVLTKLSTADFVHYAGHATAREAGPLSAHLALARGTTLTLADVLSLARGPERVLLAACDAARTSEGTAHGASLAEAFLVRGAREVIAPTRPVDDALSRRLVTQLLRELEATDALSTALARAQAALHAESPHEDWGSFRALSP